MRNLLTEKTKHDLKIEYRLRLVVVGGVLLSAALVIGIGTLFPSYASSTAREQVVQNQPLLLSVPDEKDTANSELRIAQEELKLALSLQEQTNVSERIDALIRDRAGVRLTRFVYRSGDTKDENILVVEGVAETRDDLLLFEQRLKQNPDFASVALPISNLAQERDIPFSVTLKGDL